MRWFSFSFPADDSELHALAHGIDALGADAHAVAVLPYQLLGFCAAAAPRAGCPAAAGSAGHGNDGVISLAVDAARVGGFFERADRQQALDEDFEKLHETSVFLHGNNQPVVFLAEVLLHELSGFPVHQFMEEHLGEEYDGLRSEEHTSELQSHLNLVCRLLLEKKKNARCYRLISL